MIDKNLRELLKQKELELVALQGELDAIGGGRLNIREKNGIYYFVERTDGKQKGITKNEIRVRGLSRKAWLDKKAEVVKEEVRILSEACEMIRKIDSDGIERVSNWMAKAGLKDFNHSDFELEWLRNRQSKNPYKREFLKYKTGKGVLVRSKSERFIGDFLEEKNVVYVYEPEVEIDKNMVYPDFVILCPSGRIVIWEHCGLMDKVAYFNRTMTRINEYRKIGYTQFDNLICTYEDDLDSAEVLEKIYGRYIY